VDVPFDLSSAVSKMGSGARPTLSLRRSNAADEGDAVLTVRYHVAAGVREPYQVSWNRPRWC
jgi:hypothetical protein